MVTYQQLPVVWVPVEEPWLDRVTRTELRLATFLFVFGLVAVFVTQVPLGGQVVVGAPLFEEFLKLGLALLPWAALRVTSLWVRLPTAALVGAGFGAMEHFLSYPGEPEVILWGRVLFHGMTAALSMAVLHALRGGDHRLGLLCTLPSTFLHAANNSMAVALGLSSIFLTLEDADWERISLAVGGFFLALLGAMCVTSPLWMASYRRFVERWALPRLRPPGDAVPAIPSTSSRS